MNDRQAINWLEKVEKDYKGRWAFTNERCYDEAVLQNRKELIEAIDHAIAVMQPVSDEVHQAIELLDGKSFGTHNLKCDCVYCKAMRLAVQALRRMQTEPCEWISVKDGLPNEYAMCLCVKTGGRYDSIVIAQHQGDNFWSSIGRDGVTITHWMPLPQPLKEEAKTIPHQV